MPCKGICHHHKPTWMSQTLRYANGQKRCASCEVYQYGMVGFVLVVVDYCDKNPEL